MKRHEVVLTAAAEEDLETIHLGLLERVSPQKADALLEEVLSAAETLATFPDRGAHPQELVWLGVREFRQLLCGQYRLIYRRNDDQVVIYLIADGQRDMQSLLERRLLDA